MTFNACYRASFGNSMLLWGGLDDGEIKLKQPKQTLPSKIESNQSHHLFIVSVSGQGQSFFGELMRPQGHTVIEGPAYTTTSQTSRPLAMSKEYQ